MITLGDAARILAKASAYDQRTIGQADVQAWAEALNLANPPITVEDALAAIAHWHAETTADQRIRPAHVIQGAQRLAHRRAGAQRALEVEQRLALERDPNTPTSDRTGEVADMLATLRERLGPSNPNVLRRAEWVRRERRRRMAEPNPLYQGFPPPGGWPTSEADTG